jgi:hypothetical protein
MTSQKGASMQHNAAQIKRKGTRLFDQQMWCFGQDIRHPRGNLLIEYGFTRERPPEGLSASTRYLWHGEQDQLLMLWGFGLFYTQNHQGGIFLRRFGFRPCFTMDWHQPENIWSPEDFSLLCPPRKPEEQKIAQSLLVACLFWIIGYEQWIQEYYGLAYRKDCLEGWKKRITEPEQIIIDWQTLAEQCQLHSFKNKKPIP